VLPSPRRYFFESESRRRCYLAPERFRSDPPASDHERQVIQRPGAWGRGPSTDANQDAKAGGGAPGGGGGDAAVGEQVLGIASATGGSTVIETSLEQHNAMTNEALSRFTSLSPSSLRQSMDIFSVGCVIAEIFLDGTPVFDLSALLKYKRGSFDPTTIVNGIADEEIRVRAPPWCVVLHARASRVC